MQLIRLFVGILAVVFCIPIWYYLLYQILISVNATELMWFLFWIYLPISFLWAILEKFTKEATL